MKRLTIFLLAFLFVLAGFGQRVLTYGDKVLTYGSNVLTIIYAPNEVPGLEFWLDGKDPSTVSLNVANVIQWADKSGNGRHVSNAVDAQRPTYDPATGRVTFVAANSTYLQSAAFGVALAQPNTIFILYKITGALGINGVVFSSVEPTYIWHAGGTFMINAANNLADGVTNANDNIHIVEFNGAASNYWMNGILVATGNPGAFSLDRITLGAWGNLTVPSNVEIMEVFGYNRVLSEKERTRLTNYLRDKWDLSLWLIILLIPNIRRKLKIAA